MSEASYPWGAGIVGGAVRADQWRLTARAIATSAVPGVIPGERNELAVSGDGTGKHVRLDTGVAGIYGHVYEQSGGPIYLDVEDNVTGSVRWDRVVIDADFVGSSINARVLTGNSNPSGPALQQDHVDRFQLPIGFVRVANGFSTLLSGDVFIDYGRYADSYGSAPTGTIVAATADIFPPGWRFLDGSILDWHYLPRLQAVSPNYTGRTVTYGYESSTSMMHLGDGRGRVEVGPDDMGTNTHGASRLSVVGLGAGNSNLAGGAGGAEARQLDSGMVPQPPSSLHVPGRPDVEPHTATSIVTVDGNTADLCAVPTFAWLFEVAARLGSPAALSVAGGATNEPWRVTARSLQIGSASPDVVPTLPPSLVVPKLVKVF